MTTNIFQLELCEVQLSRTKDVDSLVQVCTTGRHAQCAHASDTYIVHIGIHKCKLSDILLLVFFILR